MQVTSDTIISTLVTALGGGVGLVGGGWSIRAILRVFYANKHDYQSDQAGSQAIRTLREELDRQRVASDKEFDRLNSRIEALEQKNAESESKIEAERLLRRQAEDDLDKERRANGALIARITELERGL